MVVCDEQTAAGLFFLLAAAIPFYWFTEIRVSLKDVCKGLQKGHPTEQEIRDAVAFYQGLGE